MQASELLGKSPEELNKELRTQLEKQFRLRMKRSTGQLNETHELRNTRRTIARIKTALNAKAGS